MTPRRLVVSACSGAPFGALAELTWPAMRAYCDTHGLSFRSHRYSSGRIQRPAAWLKLIAIADGLSDHDEVAWLDADVLPLPNAPSVFDAPRGGWWQAAAMLTDAGGCHHLNTGVWLVRRQMLPWIVEAAMQDDLAFHPWWEQAAIHRLQASVITAVLPDSWNTWAGNKSQVVAPFFAHACGSADKVAELRAWSQKSEGGHFSG